MRRQFNLSERDRRFLDSLGVPWEAIREANNLWIIIHDYPIPSGYNCAFAAVAIKIESGYPDAQLDMAYFNPHLARRDGKAIPQTDTAVGLDGKTFQRWSRHRTGPNPWVPGEDSLETQCDLVRDWLRREFERRP